MIVEKIANHSLECLSVGVWEAGLHSTLMWGLGHEKKNKKKNPVLRARPTKFFLLADFFLPFFQNFVKLPLFWPKSKSFSWKFLKISQNIFPKFFCKKCLVFFTVFRVILLPEMKKKTQTNKQNQKIKNKTKKRPIDRLYLAGLSAHDTGSSPPPHGLTTPTT